MRARTLHRIAKLLGAGALAAVTWLSSAETQAKPAEKAAATSPKKQNAKATKAPSKPAGKAAPKPKAAPKGKASPEKASRAPAKSKKAAEEASAQKASSTKGRAKPSQGKSSTSRPQRTASTQPVGKSKATGKGRKKKPAPPCMRPAVEINRGFSRTETESLPLTYCDGKPAPNAIEHLSLLARPMGAARPKVLNPPPAKGKSARKGTKAKGKGKGKAAVEEKLPNGELAPGVKLVDEGLVTRLQKVVERFQAKRIYIVSGYRPASDRSFHQKAKALDFRIQGVKNEDLVAFCRTLPDTGCGYYPNSSFVHMDVRPPKTGHIYWIDASGPGENPRYVSSWPPKAGEEAGMAPEGAGESDSDGESLATSALPELGTDDDAAPSLMRPLGSDLAREGQSAPPNGLEGEIEL